MINKWLTNLPQAIVLWLGFLLLIYHSDFYYNNYVLINKIDTFVVGLSILHFLIFSKHYKPEKIAYIVCIFVLLLLELYYDFLGENLYYKIYITTISTTLFFTYVSGIRKTYKNRRTS
jgi:hypothetical protein